MSSPLFASLKSEFYSNLKIIADIQSEIGNKIKYQRELLERNIQISQILMKST